jgi:hypothetical protein
MADEPKKYPRKSESAKEREHAKGPTLRQSRLAKEIAKGRPSWPRPYLYLTRWPPSSAVSYRSALAHGAQPDSRSELSLLE